MAVMSRRKRAVAQGWEATSKQREEGTKSQEQNSKNEEISEEEHQKKIDLLKGLGLIKE